MLLFSGCEPSSTSSSEEILQESIGDINPYQIYVEKMLSYRAQSYGLYKEVENKDLLSGADMDALHQMLVRYLQTKDESQGYISKYQYLVDEVDNRYNPKQRFELVMVSLSAMLIRYDDYLISYKHYEEHDKLRTFLNTPDIGYNIPEDTLRNITDRYNSFDDRDDVQKMIEFYEDYKDLYSAQDDQVFAYLQELIENSPSYQLGFGTLDAISNWLSNVWNDIVDGQSDILSALLNGTSKGIGNTAGLVETRKGKLYEDANVAANVRAHIQIGDILLEKTPFRLTDKLIPGHWGHIAVYIGTEDELRDLGIWDDPVVVKYHQQIQEGKVIDEALRDGVQLNTIEHFLNIDDLGIMHYEGETLEAKRDRIILTLRQIGKEYDFEYDVETSDKIVCSELVYVTFLDIDFETEKLVGIHTISPDNVARKSVEDNATFSIPILYHDGEEVTVAKKIIMKKLLDTAAE